MDKYEQAQSFIQWKKENPEAFDALVDVCRRAVLKGYERWSVQAAFEVVRWEAKVDTRDGDYRLNNNLRPMVARYMTFKKLVPEGFFETREITRKKAHHEEE